MSSLELEARLDNLLFTAQEETKHIDMFASVPEREECPVCLLTLPLREDETLFMSCCGKKICCGCIVKSKLVDKKNGVPDHKQKCAFCRQPHSLQETNEMRNIKSLKKLMKKNNPDAFYQMARNYREGKEGVLQSETKSLEMCIRAAELGHPNAYAVIGNYCQQGFAMEQNISKAIAFHEVGAKKGSLASHGELARFHGKNDLYIKHMKLVASAGYQEAMNSLMSAYKEKLLSKEDLTQTLRACQASQNEMKSKDRDNYVAVRDKLNKR